MTSDSFINLSKVKSILPFPFRQATTQGDGSQSFGKQTSHFNTISRSSTNMIATGSAEPKSDLSAGHTSSPGDSSLTAQASSINVVLFGETGVGKSSVINLIARKDVAKVSSDVNGCTMQSTRYDIPFDDLNFAIFDTIGLEEPQMGVNGYLGAIERAYELIVKLGAAGGIHLLLFCMRGGRITATTQSNYRLFCECLCSTKVPIALVFTGLEREVEMEDWWTRNKTHIEHYGIKSDGHACITAVQDDTPEENLKYAESQKRIRELLKKCALKNEAFSPDPLHWFAKLGKGLRSFVEKRKNPKRRDVVKVLTNRCKLDSETARKIAEMMEKRDTEKDQGELAVIGEGEVKLEPPNDGMKGVDEADAARKNAPRDNSPPNPPNPPRTVKPEPPIDVMKGVDEAEAAKKNAPKDNSPPNPLCTIQSEPPIDGMKGIDEAEAARKNAAKDNSPFPPSPPRAVEPEPPIDMMKGVDEAARKNAAKDNSSSPPSPPRAVKPEPPFDGMKGVEAAKKNAPKDKSPPNPLCAIQSEHPIDGMKGVDEAEAARKNAAKDNSPPPPRAAKPEPPIDGMKGIDETETAKTETAKKNAAKDNSPPNPLRDVKSKPHIGGVKGIDEAEAAKKNAPKDKPPPNPLRATQSEPPIDGIKGVDEAEAVRKNAAKDNSPSPPSPPRAAKPEPPFDGMKGLEAGKKNAPKDNSQPNPLCVVEPEPRIDGVEGKDGRQPKKYGSGEDHFLGASVAKYYAPPSQPGNVNAQPRIDGVLEGRKKYESGPMPGAWSPSR